jgi:putative phage-type endonuclease
MKPSYTNKSINDQVNNHQVIKSLLKDNHDGCYYKEDQLLGVVRSFIVCVKQHKDTDDSIDHTFVAEFIAQYLHFSNKKKTYYFNLKKKQKDNLDKYTKLITFEEIKNSKEKAIVEEVTGSSSDSKDTVVEETDEDSEDMFNLESRLFGNLNDDNSEKYELPEETNYEITKRTPKDGDAYGPYGNQWVTDDQVNDIYTSTLRKRAKLYDKLRDIVLPEQRSKEWFEMRGRAITASDGGCVLGLSHYDKEWEFITKKCVGSVFEPSEACYHGKKFEEVATMIYARRMNVEVQEFGLIMHPKYKFLGASPDGICSRVKHDKVTQSKYVGRMLEIKCPFSRIIKTSGPIKDNICPIGYWIQVQLQLECCDLEECDFWQCTIKSYDNRAQFIRDTNSKEPYLSKSTGFEKGCLIQLLPKKKIPDILNGHYNDVVYDDAAFIYPTKIDMSPYECDRWIAETLTSLPTNPKYFDYMFDKVIYWKLNNSHNVVVNRDREWFAESLPKFRKMWQTVEFFRRNKDKLDLFTRFVNSRRMKYNKVIMKLANDLQDENTEDPKYKTLIKDLKKDIESAEKHNRENPKPKKQKSTYTFNPNSYSSSSNNNNSSSSTVVKSKVTSNYLFADSDSDSD